MFNDLNKFVVEEKRKEQNETLTVLEALRKSRKARGGVGAPLIVPDDLKSPGIILTDSAETSVIVDRRYDTVKTDVSD